MSLKTIKEWKSYMKKKLKQKNCGVTALVTTCEKFVFFHFKPAVWFEVIS